jgi:CDP-2,3-bis-(O-geranylgeranyl)-sn-glycerol synthase
LTLSAGTNALLLLVVANSAPWLAGRLLGDRIAAPLDFSASWPDGIRLLGDHKTWRGVIAALLACGVAGPLLGLDFAAGAGFGLLAMTGDAFSSALKRRLRRAPGADMPGLDQAPEALLPLLLFSDTLHLDGAAILAITLIFAVLDVLATTLRHRL